MVRDLCGRLGKQVEVQLQGEQTELDKTVLDKLSDPLVYCPQRYRPRQKIPMFEWRQASHRPAARLNAYHGSIVIEVSDDGAGLDSKRILEKAQNKGLVSPGDSLTGITLYSRPVSPPPQRLTICQAEASA